MTEPKVYMSALAEFVKLETEIGGPDPHLATLGEMMRDTEDLKERIWRVGCYAAGYNVPTAEAIWTAWPFERVLEDWGAFPAWINANWAGFGFRRERRAVRTREKFTRCLTSIAEWTNKTDTYDWWQENNYDAARTASSKMYGLGRYVQLKFLEGVLRYCDAQFEPKDIWPVGGKTPRVTLARLYPQFKTELLGNDSAWNCKIANLCAAWAREEISEKYGGPYLDYFRLQVALCEGGKVMGMGRTGEGKQYVGSTHDSELRYWLDARKYWGGSSEMLPAREKLFPRECLGELHGWWGKRKVLENLFVKYGIMWTDMKYSYLHTHDFAQPVAWEEIVDSAISGSMVNLNRA